ncbi:MAG: hypothetical protein NT103_07945 [Campylobacterales bacterium]|nr:hypothetical protein [Campylobacterales bacterium]
MPYTLCYTGPKPICSATGIDFQVNKEDKFIYIGPLCELIDALDYDYKESENRSIQIGQKSFDEKSIFDLIHAYNPNLDDMIDKRVSQTRNEIESDISRARSNHLINEEEKNVLINNIEIMRSYQLQRAINKCVYYAGIEVLASIIKKRHIDHVTISMEPKLLHVLHSVQGELRLLHPSLDSTIDIFEKQEHLSVALKILN